jgi:hypothetical protein
MSVPETAMNEDYGSILGKYKVGLARQPLVMKHISKTSCMQASPDKHFRLCILAADAGHHPASHRNGYDVSHR